MRRGVLEQLGRTDASITELAEKFHMTLTGMTKHVGVLEQAGLVTTKKTGRVRTCQLGPRRLEEETAWLERYRQRWDARFDALDEVVEAFTRAEQFTRWWVPKSMQMTLLSCELDARVGGRNRLSFDVGGPAPAAYFGTYLEVQPNSRLAWTNEEGGEGGPVTTVTFEEQDGKTLVVLCENHPSKGSLDAAGTGAADAMVETVDQLDELLVALGESGGR